MMRQTPRLTVITVVKNGGTPLKKTIESLSALNYGNLEYIVVNGGSGDETKEIIQRHRGIVGCFIDEPDTGIYDAMNKGWSAASGEGNILFLGAGDSLLRLPADMQRLHSGYILYGSVWLGDKRIFRSRVNSQLKFANTLHHQALIIPKRLNPDPPFNLIYRVYADFDFNQRLLKQGANFSFDREFMSYSMPGGVSTLYSEESYRISYKNFGFFWGAVSYLFFLYCRIRMRT